MSQKKLMIGIAGGSGSGKTSLARRVLQESEKIGIAGQIFSLDSYYRPLQHLTLEERTAYNFDHPDAIDFPMAIDQLRRLSEGESVELPVYDFKVHMRKTETVARKPTQLVLVEGLYALYPQSLLSFYDYRVFLSTGLATAVLRRIQRDIVERGRDIEGAKHQILTTVLPMYETYVKPTQRNAHFLINWDGEEIPEKATEGLIRMIRDVLR